MARISDMHKRWMKQSSYRKIYAALTKEFALASAAIDARSRAGLTQEALARKMGTTQPVVARLESGRGQPSIRTLERLANATDSRLVISFSRKARTSGHLLAAQRMQPTTRRLWGRYEKEVTHEVPGKQLRAA